ncbi:MAG TPA: hypothetical protein VMM81_03715, partial [Acidimicrobiia bacterium]|nr:hypothetical protein [Acidimicrobiia bacterium]
MISFVRMRPAAALGSGWLEARRAEGTTVVELQPGQDGSLALAADLLTVATSPGDEAAAWVLSPADALAVNGAGWRITILDDGADEAVLDALTRSGAAYLRTG